MYQTLHSNALQYPAIFKAFENDNFQMKNCIFFALTVHCGYLLEPLH